MFHRATLIAALMVLAHATYHDEYKAKSYNTVVNLLQWSKSVKEDQPLNASLLVSFNFISNHQQSSASCASKALFDSNHETLAKLFGLQVSNFNDKILQHGFGLQMHSPPALDCYPGSNVSAVARGFVQELKIRCGEGETILYGHGRGSSTHTFNNDFSIESASTKMNITSSDDSNIMEYRGLFNTIPHHVQDAFRQPADKYAELLKNRVRHCVESDHLSLRGVMAGAWNLIDHNGVAFVEAYAMAFEISTRPAGSSETAVLDSWANATSEDLYSLGSNCHLVQNTPLCFEGTKASQVSLRVQWKNVSDHTVVVVYGSAIILVLLLLISVPAISQHHRRSDYQTIVDKHDDSDDSSYCKQFYFNSQSGSISELISQSKCYLYQIFIQ
ncbi:hypothetical protein AeMF1_019112 [Aphanomyces euteiches]|nr:hypothetical protein AeMF1_019112 [Aphanomyces euteiches]KAH9194835.1 hypothetical protein AeNC1_003199 [Aphanomyces euteiches]